MPGYVLLHPPHEVSSEQVSMQVILLYQVPSSKIHQLAQTINYVSTPMASTTLDSWKTSWSGLPLFWITLLMYVKFYKSYTHEETILFQPTSFQTPVPWSWPGKCEVPVASALCAVPKEVSQESPVIVRKTASSAKIRSMTLILQTNTSQWLVLSSAYLVHTSVKVMGQGCSSTSLLCGEREAGYVSFTLHTTFSPRAHVSR